MRTRRPTAQAVVLELHELLLAGRYGRMLAVSEPAVARFPRDPELRLMHATALVWSRPQDAARQVAEAVSLKRDDALFVLRAANLLLHLGELRAVADYLGHAETLDGADEPPLISELAATRARLRHATE